MRERSLMVRTALVKATFLLVLERLLNIFCPQRVCLCHACHTLLLEAGE